MKKRLLVLALLSALFISTGKVQASNCDATKLTEINREASGVKVSYEEVKELVTDPDELGVSDTGATYETYKTYFKVNITNVTENLYIEITNKVDNTTKNYSSSDAVDGVISFNWYDLSNITDLTVKIYTSSTTGCGGEEILTNHVLLPKFNEYSTWQACENNPDSSVCKKYVTQEVTRSAYDKLAKKDSEAAVKKYEESNENVITRFVKKNKKGFIIGGSIIIVVGVVTTLVVISKRKRSRII